MKRRSRWFLPLLALYFVVVFAVSSIRSREEIDDHEASSVAAPLVMMLLTIGPALGAEWLLRQRTDNVEAFGRLAFDRRKSDDVTSRYQDARLRYRSILQAGASWDDEAAHLRAVYSLIARSNGASLAVTSWRERERSTTKEVS